MSTMLLSIKPEYAKVILEGKKQYEFRKIKPKEYVNHIILDSDLGGTIEPSQNREYFESTAISWMSCSNDSLVQNRG